MGHLLLMYTCTRTPLGRGGAHTPSIGWSRGVVGPGEVVAYHSPGNEGFVSNTAVIPGVGRRSPCDSDVQQLDGAGLRQQAGRDGLPFSLLVGQSASEVGGESRRPPRCQVSSRAVQRSGRSPQPSGSDHTDRVVSPPSGGERPASPLGLAVDCSVRDEFQRQASPLLFPCPRSPGSLRGCVSPSLRQPESLRVSTFPLVGWVVARVRETPNLSMTLVAPLWPEKEWFADLLLLLTQPPVALPLWDRLLLQPHFNRFHNSPASPPKVGLFARFCCRDVRLHPHLHFPVVPGKVDALLWLVSWKGRCSSQRHCTLDRGLPVPLASWQGLVCLGR